MGWFGKKDVKRDPQTGLVSVKIGDTWIQERPEIMVTRDLRNYFRDKGMDPYDAIDLCAWFCGFTAGSMLGAADRHPAAESAQPLVQQMDDALAQRIHDAVVKGMEAGRQAQDPAITARREKARDPR